MSRPTPHPAPWELPKSEDTDGRVLPFPDRTTATESEPKSEVPAPTSEIEVIETADVEFIDHDDTPVLRVDSQVEEWAKESHWLADLAERSRTARPVLPTWMRSKEEAAQVARWVAAYHAHVAAYHATRSPLYLLRLMGRSPRGLSRVVGGYARWVADTESRALIKEAAGRELKMDLGEGLVSKVNGDSQRYLMLTMRHDHRVKARLVMTALVVLPVLVTIGAVGVATVGAWWSLFGASLAFGLLGRRPDRPIIDRAVLPTHVAKLDSDAVLRALGALGISEVTKALAPKGAGINFTAPITRDGPGWRAEVDLPYGVTAADVVERREKLASGLRRPQGCVWPEGVSDEHPGRLVLWVGDQPMNKAKQAPWPLLTDGTASIFDPLPYGVDQRGRPVSITLMFANLLIGAIPRMGKTFALRLLLLAAALDVTVELRIFELKGTGDLSMLEQVCHDYGQGFTDPVIERGLHSLREVRKELVRRADVIAALPRDLCPENKVTPELAANKKLGLHPIVFAIDECQMLFDHKAYGDEASEIAEEMIRLGPALGIILIAATQRPDKDAIPTGVSANAGLRLCFKVMGQVENDMVLGTSSYKNGLRATTFTMSDKGIAYAVGVADEPQICKSALVEGPEAEKVADRARVLRERAGRLTGVAAGEVPAEDAPAASDVLEDLTAIWPAGEDKVWSVDLVDRLAGLRPEVYGPWADMEDTPKARQLNTAVKPYGIKAGPVGRTVNGKRSTKYGIDLDSLTAAMAERDENRSG
ncbi:cell division protein FtsK [Nocardiopsis aegyptia]|uniref:cell division protein FtsK n=1 Tax=Nocardiopsis aegyptia TaxID=220378 RepID=UPI00366B1ED3